MLVDIVYAIMETVELLLQCVVLQTSLLEVSGELALVVCNPLVFIAASNSQYIH